MGTAYMKGISAPQWTELAGSLKTFSLDFV